ncbi:acyltransferase domain-containing protein [Bifidobacterium sp.]|jgi:hypothetical protein|uniref:acyltransferase domain-containing protein n=1 Tax=Bifidobacterium sp. TaxID=41200 RepID=UPI0025C54369|nr:acyltransferase domain-containing protein [Bifidobacterium sp.]MCH4208765.1 acyltransferase domain-containing protein [Bifidobacterium sp.]MCI1224025.1 acyltransferase domain-containing protein [Bifidobacterium sp.]
MNALELASRIDMPEGMMRRLRACARQHANHDGVLDWRRIGPLIKALSDPAQGSAARDELKRALGPDDEGSRMLYCMLACAGAYTLDRYHALGIGGAADDTVDGADDDRVFLDTMGCFPRFVNEHKVSYGDYGFDRDFWTYRQLGASLFRLGQLEYEIIRDAENVPAGVDVPRAVAMHIPSDAVLGPVQCSDSIVRARRFVRRFFPQWAGAPYVCESWLLSPALPRLLSESSNILAFQRRFHIVATDDAAEDWREWVFRRSPAPLSELPENTSLQRAMKRYLLAGGTIGIGVGVLKS